MEVEEQDEDVEASSDVDFEQETEKVIEAKELYVLMKDEYDISRMTRAAWYFRHLKDNITLGQQRLLEDTGQDLEILSVVPGSHIHQHGVPSTVVHQLGTNTHVFFLANSYRFVFVLDISPSVVAVDSHSGRVLYDELFPALQKTLRALVTPFSPPGTDRVFQPRFYVTVIAHTSLVNCIVNQVLVQGCVVTPDSVESVLALVSRQLDTFECCVASSMMHIVSKNDLDEDEEEQKLTGGLFEDIVDRPESPDPTSYMMSPDVTFLNMLRYGILATQLLPDNCYSGIVVLSDGQVGVPDAALLTSLLAQLRHSSISCSFIHVGTALHLNSGLGQVPCSELMQFIATASFGAYLLEVPEVEASDSKTAMNIYHHSLLTWSFHKALDCSHIGLKSSELDAFSQQTLFPRSSNIDPSVNKEIWYQPMLRCKHVEKPLHVPLVKLVSCRLREGYTIKEVAFVKGDSQIEVKLVLPWRHGVRIYYLASAPWPLSSTKRHTRVEVVVEGSYDFLRDVTRNPKGSSAPIKSPYRACVVRKYWQTLTNLSETDEFLVNLHLFASNPVYYSVPESLKQGVPLFYLPRNSTNPQLNIQFTSKDTSLNQFGQFWKPVLLLDVNVWSKWMHTHRISFILEHDVPLGKHLHIPNSSGRFNMVTCRQALTSLNFFLQSWSTFCLMENHTFVKLLFSDGDSPPSSFYLLRLTAKPPCMVLRVAFISGTSSNDRKQTLQDLKQHIANLSVPQRGNAADDKVKKIQRQLTREDSVCAEHRPPALQRLCSEIACCIITHKPVEKILIRYNKMPSDFTRLQLPQDGEAPSPLLSSIPANKTGLSVFTTLSKYLHHRRWIWSAQHGCSMPIATQAIGRILNNLTKLRLQEGFHFAHTNSGIVNLVLEVDMKNPDLVCDGEGDADTQSCIVQYLIFPPHTTTTKESFSEDDMEEMETTEADGELQIVTECWVEPQYGITTQNSSQCSQYNGLDFQELSDVMFPTDLECVSTMMTFEHLNLMCINPSVSSPLTSLGCPVPVCASDHDLDQQHCDPTILHVPFPFDLLRLLSPCQQVELLFSTYIQDVESLLEERSRSSTITSDKEPTSNAPPLSHHTPRRSSHDASSPNTLLFSLFLDALSAAHHRELHLTDTECDQFSRLVQKRPRDEELHPLPIIVPEQTPQSVEDDLATAESGATKGLGTRSESLVSLATNLSVSSVAAQSQTTSLSTRTSLSHKLDAAGPRSVGINLASSMPAGMLSHDMMGGTFSKSTGDRHPGDAGTDDKPKESGQDTVPHWRCFVRAVNGTHLMVCFVPATFQDLLVLAEGVEPLMSARAEPHKSTPERTAPKSVEPQPVTAEKRSSMPTTITAHSSPLIKVASFDLPDPLESLLDAEELAEADGHPDTMAWIFDPVLDEGQSTPTQGPMFTELHGMPNLNHALSHSSGLGCMASDPSMEGSQIETPKVGSMVMEIHQPLDIDAHIQLIEDASPSPPPAPEVPKKSVHLPVYVYNCALSSLSDQLVNKFMNQSPVDIFEDLTFKFEDSISDKGGLSPKQATGAPSGCRHGDEGTSPGRRSRISECEALRQRMVRTESVNNASVYGEEEDLAHQCTMVSEMFIRCFVKGVYHALQSGCRIEAHDVDAAINGICEEAYPVEMDITQFLQTECGHIRQLLEKYYLQQLVQEDLRKTLPKSVEKGEEDHGGEEQEDLLQIDSHHDVGSDSAGFPAAAHTAVQVPLSLLLLPKPCQDLAPIHQLAQSKFAAILSKHFCPVPSQPEFYFYNPLLNDSLPKDREPGEGELSQSLDRKSSVLKVPGLSGEGDVFMSDMDEGPLSTKPLPSDRDSLVSNRDSVSLGSMDEMDDIQDGEGDLEDEDEGHDISPLFISLACSVRTGSILIKSISIKALPTCFADLRECLEDVDSVMNLDSYKVTLDIIPLTLPPEEDLTEVRQRPCYQRMTSYSSQMSYNNMSGPEDGRDQDDHLNFINTDGGLMTDSRPSDPLRHLPPTQKDAVSTCKDQVTWLLRDEVASSMRHITPVSTDTLVMVAKHVMSAEDRPNCIMEQVPLNFVYGSEQSLTHFIEDFEKMNLPGFHIVKEGIYYYLYIDRAHAILHEGLDTWAHAKALTSALENLNDSENPLLENGLPTTPLKGGLIAEKAAGLLKRGTDTPKDKKMKDTVDMVTEKSAKKGSVETDTDGGIEVIDGKKSSECLHDTSVEIITETPGIVEENGAVGHETEVKVNNDVGKPADVFRPEDIRISVTRPSPVKEIPKVRPIEGNVELEDEGSSGSSIQVLDKTTEVTDISASSRTLTREASIESIDRELQRQYSDEVFEKDILLRQTFQKLPTETDSDKQMGVSHTGELVSEESGEQSSLLGAECQKILTSTPAKEANRDLSNTPTSLQHPVTSLPAATATLSQTLFQSSAQPSQPPVTTPRALSPLTVMTFDSAERKGMSRAHSSASFEKYRLEKSKMTTNQITAPSLSGCPTPLRRPSGTHTPGVRSRHHSGLQTPLSLIETSSRSSMGEDGYEGDSSDSDEEGAMMSFNETMLRQPLLPNFWLVMRINRDFVDVFFHTRDFQETEESKASQKQRSLFNQVIKNVSSICRVVNQKLLLADLFSTHLCNQLLVAEADEDVRWTQDKLYSGLTKKKHDDSDDSDNEAHQDYYLDAARQFSISPGHFECDCVWTATFHIHPRLRTGQGRISRGVQALKSVLNKFSVNNRQNMFVIQEPDTKTVFYLRLEENTEVTSNTNKGLSEVSATEDTFSCSASRSSSILSLHKKMVDKEEESASVTSPRRQSTTSERESDMLPVSQTSFRTPHTATRIKRDNCVTLSAHGICPVGPAISDHLVSMLQRRLDDQILEQVTVMLARNPMCKLTPEDVHFIQRPLASPQICLRLTIPPSALLQQLALSYYLRQNLLQFLHTPNYMDPSRADSVFCNYGGSEEEAQPLPEENAFLYNRSRHVSGASGNGVACIHLSFVDGRGTPIQLLSRHRPSPVAYRDPIDRDHYDALVSTTVYQQPIKAKSPGPSALVRYRIWTQGAVDLPELTDRLMLAMKHAVCDIVTEYRLLTAPLCEPPPHYQRGLNTPLHSAPPSPSLAHILDPRAVCSGPDLQPKQPPPETVGDKTPKEKSTFSHLADLFRTKPASYKDTSQRSEGSIPLGGNEVELEAEHRKRLERCEKVQKYECGERGMMHPSFYTGLSDWLKYCNSLNVPAVSCVEQELLSRFPLDYILREFVSTVSGLCPDVTTRIFRRCEHNTNGECELVYQPYFPSRTPVGTQECRSESSLDLTPPSVGQPAHSNSFVLVSRNMRHWRNCLDVCEEDKLSDYGKGGVAKSLKSQLKFCPLELVDSGLDLTNLPWGFSPSSTFVPRQGLLVMYITDKKFKLYMYNWSSEMHNSLTRQFKRVVQWHNARTQLLTSIISHKMGLYQYNLFGDLRQTLEIQPLLETQTQSEMVEILVRYIIPPTAQTPSRSRNVSGSAATRSVGARPPSFHSAMAQAFPLFDHDIKPSVPMQKTSHANMRDPIHRHGAQVLEIRRLEKKEQEKRDKLRNLYVQFQQRSGIPVPEDYVDLLKKSSRLIHTVSSPLLFNPLWRRQAVGRVDHVQRVQDLQADERSKGRSRHGSGTSVKSKRSDSLDTGKRKNPSGGSGASEAPSLEESWHTELRASFLHQYVQYLQELSITEIQLQPASGPRKVNRFTKSSGDKRKGEDGIATSTSSLWPNFRYLHRTLPGGVVLLELGFKDVFCVNMYAFECSTLPDIKNTINPHLALLFTDECDRLKDLTHLHSFTHDFHLRTVQSYLFSPVGFRHNYHITGLLQTFTQQFPYAPSFAQNYIFEGVLTNQNTNSPGHQLYEYMLTHCHHYKMRKLKLVPHPEEEEYLEEEYALVDQWPSGVLPSELASPIKSENYQVGLIIAHEAPPAGLREWDLMSLRLRYWVILTNRKDIFPQHKLEKKLGIFKASKSKTFPAIGLVMSASVGSLTGEHYASMDSIPGDDTGDVTADARRPNSTEVTTLYPVATAMPSTVAMAAVGAGTSMVMTTRPLPLRSQQAAAQIECVNYLGFSNKHQAPIYTMLRQQANFAREKMERMVDSAMDHCRRDLLWTRVLIPSNVIEEEGRRRRHKTGEDDLRDPYMTRLSFSELRELLQMVERLPLREVDPQLAAFDTMPISWYQSLSRVLQQRLPAESYRHFISADGLQQHLVVLDYTHQELDMFILLSLDLVANDNELCIVFRDPPPAQDESAGFLQRAMHLHVANFVNTCCFHLWVGLLQ